MGQDAGFNVGLGTSRGNARKLIYLIDASGSLIDTLPFVIQELKRSINALDERQQFTVIFFQGEDAIEVQPAGWKSATFDNKAKVTQWIDPKAGNVVPMGSTNPLKGLTLALRYQPQLLFLFSDDITGHGKNELDRNRLLASIDKANTSRTKINTIQFLVPDRLAVKGTASTMEMISRATGAQYTFLAARDLGIE